MPQPCIATEPGRLEPCGDGLRLLDPALLQIFRFIQVQVQKMIRCGQAPLRPLTCHVIQASAHLDTDLQKRNIFRMLGVYEQGIQRPVTVDGSIFCRDPEAQIGHRGQSFEETHRYYHLKKQQTLDGECTVWTRSTLHAGDVPTVGLEYSMPCVSLGVWYDSERVDNRTSCGCG